ncbi:MAG: hypothetical protein H3C34_19080 [Caldilineaceae bacterium]|nr:hypothetical protein [Caldilineaceae bacterium]
MSRLTDFEEKWMKKQAFELPEPSALGDLCEHAKPFVAWCEELIAKTRKHATEATVNVAHLQLQAQYWARYAAAPLPHRNHIGARQGHACLFQVYRHYYVLLRELLLSINPPLLREQPQRYEAPPPQIAGVPFGILKSNST